MSINKSINSIYVIGSLRNEEIPNVADSLRGVIPDVFDDWFAAGPEADDYWKKYETRRGRNYQDALKGYAANHVFSFDKSHLDRCDAAVLVLPAGKSGHLELGYAIGSGKRCFILLDEEDIRWDVMYQFAERVFNNKEEMIEYFRSEPTTISRAEVARQEDPRSAGSDTDVSDGYGFWLDGKWHSWHPGKYYYLRRWFF